MTSIGKTPLSPQAALQEVHEEAKRLAGNGKIKYTHVLDAFRRVYRENPQFKGAFERPLPISTDLQRAEALATLVGDVAHMPGTDQQSVKAVGHALRRWTSLGAEAKRKIDQVFQTQVLQENRWARFKDKVAEFFHDLGALISQSRLSTPEDIKYEEAVSLQMEEGLRARAGIDTLSLQKPENRAQREFLKSAKELYQQRFPLESEEARESAFIFSLTQDARGLRDSSARNLRDISRINDGIRRAEDILQKRREKSQSTKDVEECISALQCAKVQKYYVEFEKNTGVGGQGTNPSLLATERGRIRGELKRMQESFPTESEVGKAIEKAIKDMDILERRVQDLQKKTP